MVIHGKENILKDMEVSKFGFSSWEKSIFDARVVGEAISEMTEPELSLATDEIIISAASITGCGIPESELLARNLSKSILSYLNDFGYSDYTVSEIIAAMRFNSNPEFRNPVSGNFFEVSTCSKLRVSVDYLASVLNKYKVLRTAFERKIENKLEGY